MSIGERNEVESQGRKELKRIKMRKEEESKCHTSAFIHFFIFSNIMKVK